MLRNITDEELDYFLRLDVNRALRIELTEEFENRCLGFYSSITEVNEIIKKQEENGIDTEYFLLDGIYYLFSV